MGWYRFFLACLVVDSHYGGITKHMHGFNPGIWAVAGFFVISGYVMRGHAAKLPQGAFYLDRFIRIYPLFLIFFLLSLVAAYWAASEPAFWLSKRPDIPALLMNAMVFPIAFANPPLFSVGASILPGALIPQAWSLGVEASFYLLLPILCARPRLVPMVLAVSVALFACCVIGLIPLGYGYNTLPANIWMFLLGYFLHDMTEFGTRKLLVAGVLVAAAWFAPALRQSPTIEVVSGALCAAWAVKRLAHCPPLRGDSIAGSMSYSIFLCHFIPLWLFAGLKAKAALSVAATLLMGAMGGWVERGVTKIRHRIRTASPEGCVVAKAQNK